MKLLPVAEEVLFNILDKNVPFSLALKNAYKYKSITKEERSLVASLVGCALRHYIVFDYHISHKIGVIDNKQKCDILLSLTDIIFIKKFNRSEVINLATSSFEGELIDKVHDLINELENAKYLIPEEYNKDSLEYLSMRFNTPYWIVKLWSKHFGKKFTYKILKANSKPSKNSCRINSSIISKGEFMDKYQDDFELTDFPDMVSYIGNKPLLMTKAGEDLEVFSLSYGFEDMLNKTDVDSLRGISIYAGYSNHLLLALMARFSSYYSSDVMVGQSQAYFDIKKQIERYNLKNIKAYECNASGLITCVSSKVHTFFVLPQNSNFSMLRSSPDYFLRVDQSSLDELISIQKTALEEASQFIEDNGELIYAVPTLNNKETNNVIQDFLNKHKDFVLEDQTQLFPFDKFDSTLYYAILKKVSINND